MALLLAFWLQQAGADPARQLIEAARGQIGVTLRYDSGYQVLGFPGGDVPLERGVCTDVLIRAYRSAFGRDLQLLVNQDMRQAFGAYPRLWGLKRPDRNIDHRRVPNLATFFRRRGQTLPISPRAEDYRAGDLVTWRLPAGVPHIGLVSDRRFDGIPAIIHNIGRGTREEDMLFAFTVTGHYRYLPPWRGDGR
ncbi:MAG: DUF1287 domain-containing protein [Methylococcaceae bacterium]|nr:DUF1287 domain-containing protein [Methylococcaceae bacterium]